MNIDYEPWNDTRKPARFERTDPTGRWAPIQDESEPAWVPWVGGFVVGCFFGFMLFLGM